MFWSLSIQIIGIFTSKAAFHRLKAQVVSFYKATRMPVMTKPPVALPGGRPNPALLEQKEVFFYPKDGYGQRRLSVAAIERQVPSVPGHNPQVAEHGCCLHMDGPLRRVLRLKQLNQIRFVFLYKIQ